MMIGGGGIVIETERFEEVAEGAGGGYRGEGVFGRIHCFCNDELFNGLERIAICKLALGFDHHGSDSFGLAV